MEVTGSKKETTVLVILMLVCGSNCGHRHTYTQKFLVLANSKLDYPVHCHPLYWLVCSCIAYKWNSLWNKNNEVSYTAITYNHKQLLHTLLPTKVQNSPVKRFTLDTKELSAILMYTQLMLEPKQSFWLQFIHLNTKRNTYKEYCNKALLLYWN